MDDSKRRQLKDLYELRCKTEQEISDLWGKFDALRQEATRPLRARSEALDMEMSSLLGETHSWIEGQFDADGLPTIFVG